MRTPKTGGATRCVLLAALLSSIGAHAAVTDTKKPSKQQPVSAVADTQTSSRHQGAVNVGGINWSCSGVRCNTMAPAAAVPLALCQGLARKVGALRSFSVANRPLNGNELQQCNSAAPAAVAALPSMKTPQSAGLPPAAPVPRAGLSPLQPPVGLAPTPAQAATPAPNTSQHKDRLITPKDFTPMASPLPAEPQRVAVKPGQQPAPSPYPKDWTKPAKKPSGAKGSTPAPQPSPPAETVAPTAPGPRSYPVSIRTDGLSVTGTGGITVDLPFTPKSIRTEGLSVTGIGVVAVDLPFTPKSIRTEGLSVTGTGSIR